MGSGADEGIFVRSESVGLGEQVRMIANGDASSGIELARTLELGMMKGAQESSILN